MKKKKIFVIILVCFIILIILALLNYSNKQLAELKTIEDITMTIKENSLTDSSAVIVITNNTETDYFTDKKFRIDRNIEGKWYEMSMKEDMVTTMESLNIISGDSLELDLYWERYYGNLGPGKYRIVKDVTTNDNHQNYNIEVEFSLE